MAWWHRLQGGAIAAQRPPPPGATDLYPNLARVPPRPQAVDPTVPRTIGAGLELDRVMAAQAAAEDPLTPPSAPAAPPAATPPQPGAPSARVTAAEAPAPPPAPPPPPIAAAAPGPLPTVPPAPPPPPALSHLAIPMTLPAAPPPPPPAPGAPHLAESVIVAFPLGSAALPPPAAASLRALAARRHGAPVAVQARGEAPVSAPPAVQAQALALGLRRAQAMADTLVGAGVPVGQVRIEAQAVGRGGTARLLD